MVRQASIEMPPMTGQDNHIVMCRILFDSPREKFPETLRRAHVRFSKLFQIPENRRVVSLLGLVHKKSLSLTTFLIAGKLADQIDVLIASYGCRSPHTVIYTEVNV